MSTTVLVIVAGILAVGIVLCVATLLAVQIGSKRKQAPDQRGDVCPRCHFPLPQDATSCPACSRTPPEPLPPTAKSDQPTPALIGLSGSLAQRIFPIPPAPRGLTIGRNPDNDIVISDMLIVSRYHAQVVPEDDAFVLYDRNSVNGTAVNDQRIFRHELQDGDQIQICGACFAFSRSGKILSPVSEPPIAAPQTGSLAFSPGSLFEGYAIEEQLGQGGMSVVYKARSPEGSTVAIKILNVTDEYAVRKFIQEQQIGAVLCDHPYIRRVHKMGRSQTHNLYLVMEYVDGYPLRRLIGALSDEKIVRFVGQTCMALAYAHKQHIVHRDIKPENILITHDGTTKLADFGISKLTSSVTVTSDHVVGTPEYLSPEQAQGEQSIQPTADIYALGIVLYELLAGQVPFPLPRTGDPYQAAITVLRQHIHTPPPLPREHNPQVTPHLERVALRAIEKEPRKRFPTALAMSEALGYEAGTSLEAAEPAPLQKFSLVVTKGTLIEHCFPVEAESVVIGRANLCPEEAHVSRRHAIVSLRGNQLWLEDTSLNGTHVNGERVFGEVLLQPGDEIGIGESVLRVMPYAQ